MIQPCASQALSDVIEWLLLYSLHGVVFLFAFALLTELVTE